MAKSNAEKLADRFWSKVTKTDWCWEWAGRKSRLGYGQFDMGGTSHLPHRLSFSWLVSEIPDDKELDHLCRNRACVKPSHLEVVTHRENVMRGVGVAALHAKKTHCVHGHPLSGPNIRLRETKSGVSRVCLKCQRIADAKSYAKKKKEGGIGRP